MTEVRVGYMCKVDYDHELGEAMGGSVVYPSIKDLQRKEKAHDHCGIVKVAVICLKVAVKEKRYTKKEVAKLKKQTQKESNNGKG